MSGRAARAVAWLATIGVSAGCGLFHRGPSGMEGALERQLDCDLNRQFGLELGSVTAPIASGILRAAADDEHGSLVEQLHLRHVGVAVFEVREPGDKPARLDPRKLGLEGWETVLRVKDDGDQVLLMSRPERGGIREAVLVSYDGEEVVVVRVKGQLDGLIQAAAAAARDDAGRRIGTGQDRVR